MRPIRHWDGRDRSDSESGRPKREAATKVPKYDDYQSYLPHLVRSYGRYCYACGSVLYPTAHVEHRISKSSVQEKENDSHNLFPACPGCNSSKSSKTNYENWRAYLWPDSYNTYAVYKYGADGNLEVDEESIQRNLDSILPQNSPLWKELEKKDTRVATIVNAAHKTLDLFGLSKVDHAEPQLQLSQRQSVWALSQAMVKQLLQKKSVTKTDCKIFFDTVESMGFWMMWANAILPAQEIKEGNKTHGDYKKKARLLHQLIHSTTVGLAKEVFKSENGMVVGFNVHPDQDAYIDYYDSESQSSAKKRKRDDDHDDTHGDKDNSSSHANSATSKKSLGDQGKILPNKAASTPDPKRRKTN